MLPNSILKQGLVPKQKEDSTTKKQKGIKNFAREGHIFFKLIALCPIKLLLNK